ncbi:DUF4465 domain-containing protein [Myroides marinus]|uniref:DUF4465 domain-containing protein n=1 Tax=Myroides marinus TaxID=703342 RepID=UPI0025749713|nr:DUF4465 domain-containing protein [Myroides marinus]MDM1380544.1 DUF4465 domain-containing protein [Myroides marinus]MDM1387779.1 DUF4465 domain-containing protein [Myroides marinus]MDM1395028.1 DUF4465 domain-containing protein [Myroides marinus]
MKKHLLKFSSILFLGLTLSTATVFTSCSNDDNVPYSIPTFNGNVESVTFDEVTIDPKLNNNGASYRWINNATQQVLSTQQILKHTFNTPGTYNLVLSEQNGSSYRYYTYNVIVSKSYNYNYVTLDLSTFNLTDGQATTGGKIWKDTFTDDAVLKSGIFDIKHIAYSEYYTWMGFTVSNSSDNTNQYKGNGWLENQWGTMPQGGVAGKGTPFLVSFADHKPNAKLLDPSKPIAVDRFSSVITLDDPNNTYKAVSANFAISPWPYYGILEGDAYARKFKKGDFFAIHIYGVDKNKKLTSAQPVTHYFVDFREGVNEINTNWNKVDLSSLGEVKYLVFFLETTDVGKWGANTALYFTMDGLTVDKIDKN